MAVSFLCKKVHWLIPTAGKDFRQEAIEELIAVTEEGDPMMTFAERETD